MTKPIQLTFGAARAPITLTAVGDAERVSGWRYLWLKYVWGFAPAQHCANCLRGRFSERVRVDMPIGEPIVLDEAPHFDLVYLCGVSPNGWRDNLHFPLEYAHGKTSRIKAYDGVVFEATNARRLPIPALPKGFAGFSTAFTTCRNWRFGVSYYGLASDPTQLTFESPVPLIDPPAK